MTIVVERRWSSLSERCCSAWSRTKWPARAADTSHVSGHFVRDDEEGDLETSAGDPRPRSGPAPLRRQSESRQLTNPGGTLRHCSGGPVEDFQGEPERSRRPTPGQKTARTKDAET